MGSGKTSIGKKLSRWLDYDFVDTDARVERKENKKISEIFEQEGEIVFREKEHLCFLEVLNLKNTVVSTGGGLPCHSDHIQLMNAKGLSIYLKADSKFLASRLTNAKANRPLIASVSDDLLPEFLEELLKKREVCYEQSHIKISSKNLKVKDIVEAMKLQGFSF